MTYTIGQIITATPPQPAFAATRHQQNEANMMITEPQAKALRAIIAHPGHRLMRFYGIRWDVGQRLATAGLITSTGAVNLTEKGRAAIEAYDAKHMRQHDLHHRPDYHRDTAAASVRC